MLNLIKYELFKTKTLLIIFGVIAACFLVASACFTAFFEMGIFFTLMFGGFFLSAVMLVPFLYTILIYHKDISKKVGYMTYLTPHNQFEIIGAKIITSAIITIFAWLSLALIVVVNYLLVKNLHVDIYEIAVNNYTELFEEMFVYLPKFSTSQIIVYCISIIASSFILPVNIIFSITFMYTLFPAAKSKGLWVLLVYLFSTNILNGLSGVFKSYNIFDNFNFTDYMTNSEDYLAKFYSGMFSFETIVNSTIVMLVMGIVLYFVTCILAEKKLSV